jgi:hypothetical protein
VRCFALRRCSKSTRRPKGRSDGRTTLRTAQRASGLQELGGWHRIACSRGLLDVRASYVCFRATLGILVGYTRCARPPTWPTPQRPPRSQRPKPILPRLWTLWRHWAKPLEHGKTSLPLSSRLTTCTQANPPPSSIKLTTSAPQSQTFEGTLFTACPVLNLVAINTRPTPASDSGDYHIIPVSRIQNFQITAVATQQQPTALPPVDTKRLKERETARIAQLKDQAADRGKGVSKEAQAIYDALKRV